MSRKDYLVVIGLSLIAGFTGGAISGQLYMDASIHEVLRAEEIQLSDGTGQVRAEFVLGIHGEPGLALYDSDGRPRITLGLGVQDEPSLHVLDHDGTITWSAP